MLQKKFGLEDYYTVNFIRESEDPLSSRYYIKLLYKATMKHTPFIQEEEEEK